MFDNISIGVRTFLRDDKLFRVIDDIRRGLPGAQMIVADCGEMTEEKDSLYAELEREGHIHLDLPFDAGFGAMSNAIALTVERPYLLVASDDFDFSPIEVRHGIEKLLHVAWFHPEFDVLSGRVNNNPYEFFLEEKDGAVREINANCDKPNYWYGVQCGLVHAVVDLTVNYSLIRRDVFKKVRWDNDVKIGGGEHGAFFIDCKRAGFKTMYVAGVNINEQQGRNSPRYNMYRRRALDPARPCFDRRGIRKYVLGSGQIDYEKI